MWKGACLRLESATVHQRIKSSCGGAWRFRLRRLGNLRLLSCPNSVIFSSSKLIMKDIPYDIWRHITTFLRSEEITRLFDINSPLFDIAMNERYRKVRIGSLADTETERSMKRLVCVDIKFSESYRHGLIKIQTFLKRRRCYIACPHFSGYKRTSDADKPSTN